MKKLDKTIERFNQNAEYERNHGNLQGYLEFKQLVKWLTELRARREMYRKEHMDDYLRTESEDCISRAEVLSIYDEWFATCDIADKKTSPKTKIKALPSVQPKSKTGRWIMKHRTYNEVKHYTGQDETGETHTISVLERYEDDEPYCSECGKRAGDTSQDYCCACGARMIDPQESEEA